MSFSCIRSGPFPDNNCRIIDLILENNTFFYFFLLIFILMNSTAYRPWTKLSALFFVPGQNYLHFSALFPPNIRSVVLGACTLPVEQVIPDDGRRTHSKGPVGPNVVGMIMRGVTRNVAHSAAEDA